jgi:hypothetical protein
MPENGATANDVGRVGTITRISDVGRDYELTYSFDSAIQPLPNGLLEHLAHELAIGDWEFTRTHWAIKDVDLFYVLLLHGMSRPTPKVFRLSEEPVDDLLLSVMLPFNVAFKTVYEAIAKAAKEVGMRCQRADDIWKHEAIIQDVVQLICTSKIVVCDLSGKNSNVFYETGIAHALGKDVVMITQAKDDIPFDLRHLRFIEYLNNGEGRSLLAAQLVARVATLLGK